MKLFCLAFSLALVLSACGNSSYNDRSLILSDEDSYTYQKCVDTGSTDTSLKRDFQGFNGKETRGKFKVLLVSGDYNITTLLEGDDTQNTSIDLEKGPARLILVGDHASGSCKITLNETNHVRVVPPSGGLDSEEWINDFFDDWM